MSRLDDELHRAFRREQPSGEFTARLLERVAQQPAPKARWQRRLATLLDPPKLRWVAIGVTASLLLAIGAAQYSRMRRVVVNDNGVIAQGGPSQESNNGGSAKPETAPSSKDSVIVKPSPRVNRVAGNHRLAQIRHKVDSELRAEGEAAKEKLMLALSIASSALNDAQKAVHDDGLKP